MADFSACLGMLYAEKAAEGGLMAKGFRGKAKEAFQRAATARLLALGPEHPATLAAKAAAGAGKVPR